MIKESCVKEWLFRDRKMSDEVVSSCPSVISLIYGVRRSIPGITKDIMKKPQKPVIAIADADNYKNTSLTIMTS
jgi:hypothetical protein